MFLFLSGRAELLIWGYLVGPMRRRFVSVCRSETLGSPGKADRYTRTEITGWPGSRFEDGFLELGGCLAGVTIWFTRGLLSSLDFARRGLGEQYQV